MRRPARRGALGLPIPRACVSRHPRPGGPVRLRSQDGRQRPAAARRRAPAPGRGGRQHIRRESSARHHDHDGHSGVGAHGAGAEAQVDAAALAAERARQDSVRKLLEPLLVVTVVKKTYLPRNPDSEQYEDYISLAFAYQNKGEKAIRAFQGDATFLDTFGDSIYSAHLKVDLPLTPGQTRREPARIVRVNPFRVAHQRLRDTPLEKMKLVWQTSDVVFADGNRLSLSAP